MGKNMIKKQNISGVMMLIFSIILAIGAVFSIFATHGSVVQPSLNEFLKGKWTSAYEKKFDEALFHYKPSLGFWNVANFKMFKEGKDGVIIGKDGWLFTTEEFDRPKGFNDNISANIDFITQTHQVLSAQNIKLFVIPIPSKARLLKEKLERQKFPAYRKPIYANFISTLNAKNIHHMDLAFIIQKPEDFFLKTDTHWAVAGAELTAMSAANRLFDLGLVKSKTEVFETTLSDPQTHEGDLMRYTVNGQAAQFVNLNPDTIRIPKTLSTTLNDDLFSDPQLDIALVGTSYSANKEWNFEGFLKQYLSADVLNMADEGLGPFETMQNYLLSNTYKNTPPKLVIWEIPERFLPVYYDLNI